ncbi:hypothetical protein K1T35_23695 [Pseudonocardia sp. DSM 110487]|uniref:hypothetical protein n=1 Tax=Pseudonocardia sp. DSM 110487 TaxID=2865833 RepID=UPI001C6992EC|nr:hypothetical protein [Pseudonocardia sp. DSM 110487]QYN31678.1 hypothetical protein K1T35_23695 [Pseudonocardia sp. DSM 110487]
MINFFRHQRWLLVVAGGAVVICVILMLLRSKGVEIVDVVGVFLGIVAIAIPIAWDRQARQAGNSPPRRPGPPGRRRFIVVAAWILAPLMLLVLVSGFREPDVRVADRLVFDAGQGESMSDESTARLTLAPPFEPRERIFLQFVLTAPETVSKSGNCVNPSRLTIDAIADGHVSGTATEVSSLEEVRLPVENAARLSVDVTYDAPTPECRVDLSVADAYLYNEFPP